MYLKKEAQLFRHASNIILETSQCLSTLLYFLIFTPSYYFTELLILIKIDSEIKNKDFKNMLFSFMQP